MNWRRRASRSEPHERLWGQEPEGPPDNERIRRRSLSKWSFPAADRTTRTIGATTSLTVVATHFTGDLPVRRSSDRFETHKTPNRTNPFGRQSEFIEQGTRPSITSGGLTDHHQPTRPNHS